MIVGTLVGLAIAGLAMGLKRGEMTIYKPNQFDPSIFSRYYTKDDVKRSATAANNNIPNNPSGAQYDNASKLAQFVLDPIADTIGKQPIVSWYRSKALNDKVGGSSNSDHLEALAADLDNGANNAAIVRTVLQYSIPFDQMIIYDDMDAPKWIHISYDPNRDPADQKREIKFKSNGTYSTIPVSTALNFYA